MIDTTKLINIQDDLWVLDYYHSWKSGKQKDFDKKIMNMKCYDREDWKVKKQNEAVKYFYNRLRPLFTQQHNLVICVIPPSDINKVSHIMRVAKLLIDNHGFRDGYSFIQRSKKVESAHDGGDRSYAKHINSIKLRKKDLINNRTIILLDDVTTSGNAMRACTDILMQAGASKVYCIALGKTVKDV